MYLIIGLGNPGSKYEHTRHNLGFMALDCLADSSLPWKSEYKALTQKLCLAGHDVVLAKPQTFMNLSGEAVQALMSWYKVPVTNVIVMVDDVTLDCGRVRVRGKGSHGGQNGLRSIIEKVGDAFPRIRIGEGKCPPCWEMSDWVLSKVSSEDKIALKPVFKHIPAIVTSLMNEGVEVCMGRYNGPLAE